MNRTSNIGQDVVFYIAVANLYLLPFWFLAFARNGMPTDEKFVEHFYELAQVFDHVDYLAAVLLGLVAGISIFIVSLLLKRASPRLGTWLDGGLAAGGLAIFAMAIWVLINPPSGNLRVTDDWIVPIIAIGGGVALLLVVAGIFLRGLVGVVMRYAVLATAPIGLMLALNAAVAAYKIAPPDGGILVSDRSLAPIQPRADGKRPRVVVIFFDMWDYGVTFERRPAWLKLPAVDRLAGEAYFATQAYRAAAYTRLAFPSMLTGRKVYWSWPTPGDDLALLFAERYAPESWRANPGLFKSVRDSGYNTAVVAAAYHPYCRLFRQYISRCWIDDTEFFHGERTIFNRMDDVLSEVLRRIPFVNRMLFEPRRRYQPEWGVHLYFAFKEEMKRVVADRDYDLVFAHWYLPHPPFIRDYKTGEWAYFDEQAPLDNYFGNLQALDLAVGEIRRTLETAGLWDDTTVVLTADHGYTLLDWPEYVPEFDPRVPFIMKLAGQKERVVSDKKFMMTSLRALLEAVFQGDATEPAEVERYLDYPEYHH